MANSFRGRPRSDKAIKELKVIPECTGSSNFSSLGQFCATAITTASSNVLDSSLIFVNSEHVCTINVIVTKFITLHFKNISFSFHLDKTSLFSQSL